MNDLVLRDIIPSNDSINLKELRKKRFSKTCKILMMVFILGILAIAIVLVGLVLIFSGKSFINYINKSSKDNLEARIFSDNLQKITILPSLTKSTKHKQINISSTTFYSSLNSKQLTSINRQTTQENNIITIDSVISTFFIQKFQGHTIASSTNENKKK